MLAVLVTQYVVDLHEQYANKPRMIITNIEGLQQSDFNVEEVLSLKAFDEFNYPEYRLLQMLIAIVVYEESDLDFCCEAYELCFSPSTRLIIKKEISDYLADIFSKF